jgi:predicted acylesterase/phospholipase RssA
MSSKKKLSRKRNIIDKNDSIISNDENIKCEENSESNPENNIENPVNIPEEKPKITTLIMASAGIKGVSYIGFLKYLENNDMVKNINKIIGNSAGSIFSLYFILGYNYTELYNFFSTIKIADYQDITADSLLQFTDTLGLDTGKKLEEYIKNIFINKGLKYNITFKELYEKNPIHFMVYSTCITDGTYHVFDYINNPDMEVWLAIRISSSVPFLYSPVKYKDKEYIDGGVNISSPIHLIEDEIENTIIVDCIKKYERETIMSYITTIINCCQYYGNKNLEKYSKYIIIMDLEFYALNFNLDSDTILSSIDIGYNITEKYFKTRFDN